jgi:hypothetical protein
VVSGVQSGYTHTVTLYEPAGSGNVISVRTFYSTNIVGGMTVNLYDSTTWQVLAQNFTDVNGQGYFYGMPPGDYLVGNPDLNAYAAGYWSSPIIDGVEQTNRFDIYLCKYPLIMEPAGTLNTAPQFYWIPVPEAAWFNLELYRNEANGSLTLLDQAIGRFQTNYLTTATFETNASYQWYVHGSDFWGNPVMSGQAPLVSWFTGPGGGTGHAGCDQRLFGMIRYSTFPVAGLGLMLTNYSNSTGYQTATDDQGWYRFEGVAAGNYTPLLESTAFNAQSLAYLTMPTNAGPQGVYYLSKIALNMQPAVHQTVHTAIPTFSWTPNPEAVSYTVGVTTFSTGEQVFSQPGLKAASFASPVALANGDYLWSVQGNDSAGNLVLSGMAKFTVQVP